MKRQILIIASVAVVSFLFGTLVSMGLTASGVMSNPFEKRASGIQIIRFTDPEEMNVTGRRTPSFYNLTEFVWTPRNPKNNTILRIYYQLEYRCEYPEQFVWSHGSVRADFHWELQFHLRINAFVSEPSVIHTSAETPERWAEVFPTTWDYVSFVAQPPISDYSMGLWISPNQNNYTLGFECFHYSGESSHTFLRNVNVIMEVIDG